MDIKEEILKFYGGDLEETKLKYIEAKARGLKCADDIEIFPYLESYKACDTTSRIVAILKSNYQLEKDRVKTQKLSLFSENYDAAASALSEILKDKDHPDIFKAISFVLKGQGSYIEQLAKNKANVDLPVSSGNEASEDSSIKIDSYDARF